MNFDDCKVVFNDKDGFRKLEIRCDDKIFVVSDFVKNKSLVPTNSKLIQYLLNYRNSESTATDTQNRYRRNAPIAEGWLFPFDIPISVHSACGLDSAKKRLVSKGIAEIKTFDPIDKRGRMLKLGKKAIRLKRDLQSFLILWLSAINDNNWLLFKDSNYFLESKYRTLLLLEYAHAWVSLLSKSKTKNWFQKNVDSSFAKQFIRKTQSLSADSQTKDAVSEKLLESERLISALPHLFLLFHTDYDMFKALKQRLLDVFKTEQEAFILMQMQGMTSELIKITAEQKNNSEEDGKIIKIKEELKRLKNMYGVLILDENSEDVLKFAKETYDFMNFVSEITKITENMIEDPKNIRSYMKKLDELKPNVDKEVKKKRNKAK